MRVVWLWRGGGWEQPLPMVAAPGRSRLRSGGVFSAAQPLAPFIAGMAPSGEGGAGKPWRAPRQRMRRGACRQTPAPAGEWPGGTGRVGARGRWKRPFEFPILTKGVGFPPKSVKCGICKTPNHLMECTTNNFADHRSISQEKLPLYLGFFEFRTQRAQAG